MVVGCLIRLLISVKDFARLVGDGVAETYGVVVRVIPKNSICCSGVLNP